MDDPSEAVDAPIPVTVPLDETSWILAPVTIPKPCTVTVMKSELPPRVGVMAPIARAPPPPFVSFARNASELPLSVD